LDGRGGWEGRGEKKEKKERKKSILDIVPEELVSKVVGIAGMYVWCVCACVCVCVCVCVCGVCVHTQILRVCVHTQILILMGLQVSVTF
jgi:hypothetical protein